MYRWGNPQNYGRGGPEDQVLDANHGVYEIPYGFPGRGNILLFNNRTNQTAPNNLFSSVIELTPDINEDGTYHIEDGKPFGPDNVVWEYENDFHSGSQSGAFRLPNGNTLINWGSINNSGAIITEVTNDKNIAFEIRFPNPYKIYKARKHDWMFSVSLLSGDANLDNIVDIMDINHIVDAFDEMSPYLDLYHLYRLDTNKDGEIDVGDVDLVIEQLLYQNN